MSKTHNGINIEDSLRLIITIECTINEDSDNHK